MDGVKYNLDAKFGVFSTINTDMVNGRSIPESMKSMFRNVTCMAPDNETISTIMLTSDGFWDAKVYRFADASHKLNILILTQFLPNSS